MRIPLYDDAPRYAICILTHLSSKPPSIEETNKGKLLEEVTVQGVARALDIPTASAFRAFRWLEDEELIEGLPQRCYSTRDSKNPARPYCPTLKGRAYAEAISDLIKKLESIA